MLYRSPMLVEKGLLCVSVEEMYPWCALLEVFLVKYGLVVGFESLTGRFDIGGHCECHNTL